MSAEHNHPRRCCCEIPKAPTGAAHHPIPCLGCPQHGACICDLARSEPLDHKGGPHHEAFCPRFRATPYTEQETTNG